jgi:hypothetical protein
MLDLQLNNMLVPSHEQLHRFLNVQPQPHGALPSWPPGDQRKARRPWRQEKADQLVSRFGLAPGRCSSR